ncbi:MAG: sigma 54-interacting transcriptional regulator [Desulfobacteraceae bacterium]|jgi:PAS domain S-box-containing protein
MAKGTASNGKLVFYDQLRTLLGDLHIGVFTVDSSRKITSFNRAAELLTGYHEEDVIGKYCHQVFQNDLCRGECKYHEAVEAEKTSLNFDVEITDRYNEKRTFTKIVSPLYNINRDLIGCIEIFQDRSAFEELISRIRYGERQMKIILDNLDIGVFTVTRGGLINFFNTMAESISGYRRIEVLGKPCAMILGEDPSSGSSLLNLSVADGRPRSNKKGLLTTKDGRTIPIRANYVALRNEQGRVVGGLATVQDLSLIYQLNRAISSRYTFADMIGKDPAVQKIFEIVPVVADSEATVLIEGPTGTGKDLLAKVIHNASKRSGKPMVKVNCAALPDNLLESEMFGYVKGAFTGAERDKPGRFQEADGGTIFLDEIGDLPLSLQAKLLRVLEDKEFYPLGSRKTTKVDVRIIAATNQDLESLVEEKSLRKDLFYRLNVIGLELPPLKDRRGDIPLLIDHIVRKLSALRNTQVTKISEEAMEMLLNYDYPGNVRELENILEHALIICQEEIIEPRHLPIFLQNIVYPQTSPLKPFEQDTSGPQGEKLRILDILKRHNWHRGKTARELKIDRTTLWRKMKRYNLIS